jgi:tetratricopeptide (TPR) repeat protein
VISPVSLRILFAAALTAGLSAASAQEEPETEQLSEEEKEAAKRHFVAGSEQFEAGNYREAIDHFEAGYEISRSPEFLYNLGRCHEELGENRRAVENYETYLKLRPDAEDEDEVRGRIARLQEDQPEPDEPPEADQAAEDEPEWPPGLRIGAASGASFLLPVGAWKGASVPLDLLLHYPLNDWLFLSGVFSFGSYLDRTVWPVGAAEPKSQVGLFVGVAAELELSRRLSGLGRLGVTPTGVFRKNYKTATWLAFQVGAGLAVWVWGGWGLFVEALGTVGPVFIPDARAGDPWIEDGSPSLAVDVGGRVGFYYAFE